MDSKTQEEQKRSIQGYGVSGAWHSTLLWLCGLLLVAFAVFYSTIQSLVSVWSGGETFTHGFFIAPISFWLIWQKREQLFSSEPTRDALSLIPLLGGGVLWMLGNVADIQIVQHVAFVTVLICLIWGMIGRALAWSIAFPLGFLWLMVPFGEEFIPPLMDLTAETTVWLVRASGIPVYQEGLYFSLPSGNWSVVEACSGVRYLISSIVLGFLYSYLTYTRYWKRALFIVISCVVPIAANSARAYMIVMIGHLSGMELATGVDHLIYGWVFFGLVMLILFWLGGFFKDASEGSATLEPSGIGKARASVDRTSPVLFAPALFALVALAVMIVGPALAYISEHRSRVIPTVQLTAPTVASWELLGNQSDPWSWQPRMVNPTGQFVQFYQQAGDRVGLYVYQYAVQEQGAELVNRQNKVVADSKLTKLLSTEAKGVQLNESSLTFRQSLLQQGRQSLLVWEFNRMGSGYIDSDYLIKLKEVWAKVSGGREDSARIFVATLYDPDRPMLSADRLKGFLQEALPQLEMNLDQSAGL